MAQGWDSGMVNIKRTFDTKLVRSIIGETELFKRSGDAAIEMYDPENQPELIYLTPMRAGEVIGITVFHVFNNMFCYQGHMNYLPQYWGTWLIGHTKDAINWMFDNTECTKIVAFAPDYYPEVLKHTMRVGFEVEGYLKNSTMSNGKLDNMTLVSIEK